MAKPSDTFIAGGMTVDGKPVEESAGLANGAQNDATVVNPDEVNVDDDYMDDGDDAGGDQDAVPVSSVPASVFRGTVIEEEFE